MYGREARYRNLTSLSEHDAGEIHRIEEAVQPLLGSDMPMAAIDLVRFFLYTYPA